MARGGRDGGVVRALAALAQALRELEARDRVVGVRILAAAQLLVAQDRLVPGAEVRVQTRGAQGRLGDVLRARVLLDESVVGEDREGPLVLAEALVDLRAGHLRPVGRRIVGEATQRVEVARAGLAQHGLGVGVEPDVRSDLDRVLADRGGDPDRAEDPAQALIGGTTLEVHADGGDRVDVVEAVDVAEAQAPRDHARQGLGRDVPGADGQQGARVLVEGDLDEHVALVDQLKFVLGAAERRDAGDDGEAEQGAQHQRCSRRALP